MFHFCIPQTPFLLLLHIINECTNNETHLHQIHLGCCLKFLGCYGNGASFHNASNLFKLSYGTALNFVRKAISAILQLKEHVIKWPDCSERLMIGKGYKDEYMFPNCIGVIDITIFPLAFKPIQNRENYFTRKLSLHCKCSRKNISNMI